MLALVSTCLGIRTVLVPDAISAGAVRANKRARKRSRDAVVQAMPYAPMWADAMTAV